MPKISVIIPAYNAGAYIARAIDSVLAQTYQDFEIIVIDDGSTDNTRERVAAYSNRVTYLYQPNSERSAARNRGLRAASGDFFAFLDADDQWLPERLAKELALFDRYPGLGLVYAYAKVMDDHGGPYGTIGTAFPTEQAANFRAFEGLLLGKYLPIPTVLIRQQCLDTAGLFDEGVSISEDWDLWLRVAVDWPMGFVPEPLAIYHVHGTFLPKSMTRGKAQETRPYIVRKVIDYARTRGVSVPLDLEAQALANAHWRSALLDYAVGNWRGAIQHWQQSLQLDPSFWATPKWTDSLIDYALHMVDTGTPPDEARHYVQYVFAHLPPSITEWQSYQRQTIGQLRAGYAFQALEQDEPCRARNLMRAAVKAYPPLLRNLGVISICLYATPFDRWRQKLKAARIT
jgi:GT2 family glycosyltransferase